MFRICHSRWSTRSRITSRQFSQNDHTKVGWSHGIGLSCPKMVIKQHIETHIWLNQRQITLTIMRDIWGDYVLFHLCVKLFYNIWFGCISVLNDGDYQLDRYCCIFFALSGYLDFVTIFGDTDMDAIYNYVFKLPPPLQTMNCSLCVYIHITFMFQMNQLMIPCGLITTGARLVPVLISLINRCAVHNFVNL